MKGIYKIENTKNGKFYIGSCVDFKKRKTRHLYQLRKKTHHSILLQRAFDKHGEDSFKFTVIEECENILEREQEFLDKLDYAKSYNVSKYAGGGDRISGHPNEKEIREKIKDYNKINRPKKEKVLKGRANIEKEKNPNWKGGISISNCTSCFKEINCGSKMCSECYFKSRDISKDKNPFYGKNHSKESRKKISISHLGKYNGNQEKIVLVDGNEYKSLSETARVFGVVPATILNRIKSKNYPNYSYRKNSNDYPEREYATS